MMIMPSNNSSGLIHYAAGKYPGRVGWLIGPTARFKTKPRAWMPYALDNDAFQSWASGKPWDVESWRGLLKWANAFPFRPLWALVPDVVADKEKTLESWKQYAPELRAYGWPLAFACQDGMTPDDVPADADLIFIGGSTEWKWKSLKTWAANFKRVHVGRVNELRKVHYCENLGVESVDGTGWLKDGEDGRKARNLVKWLDGKSRFMELDLLLD